jgi:homoserine kinase type II
MLLKIIKNSWPIGRIISINRYKHGVINDTYRVVCDKGAFSLRIYRKHVLKDVEFEVSLLEHLRGMKTPRITRIKSEKIIKIGGRYAVIYNYIKGVHLKLFIKKQLESVGAFLAHFHNKGYDFIWQKKRHKLYDLGLRRIKSIESLCKKNKIVRMDIFYEVKKEVIRNKLNKDLPRGVIHVDVKPGNVLFYRGILSGVLDFDNAYFGPYILDLAKSMVWFGLNKNSFCLGRASHLYRGYIKFRALSRKEYDSLFMAFKFAFASHIFVDFYMHASGKTSKEYFNFIIGDFYKAYKNLNFGHEEFYRALNQI